MVKAVGIAGSPRRDGNSSTLLEAALRGAASAGAETARIHLHELTYSGCQGCERCGTQGACVIRDALSPVHSALWLADVWLLACPIYFDGVSGQMKTFFDRCYWMAQENGERRARLPGRRQAAFIVTSEADPYESYQAAVRSLGGYLSWMGDFGEVQYIFAGGLGARTAAAGSPDLLQQAEQLGRRLVTALRSDASAT
jgi:multimeric flavodoxin WrbA